MRILLPSRRSRKLEVRRPSDKSRHTVGWGLTGWSGDRKAAPPSWRTCSSPPQRDTPYTTVRTVVQRVRGALAARSLEFSLRARVSPTTSQWGGWGEVGQRGESCESRACQAQ